MTGREMAARGRLRNYEYRMCLCAAPEGLVPFQLLPTDHGYRWLGQAGWQTFDQKTSDHLLDESLLKEMVKSLLVCFESCREYLLRPDGLMLATEGFMFNEEGAVGLVFMPFDVEGMAVSEKLKGLFQDLKAYMPEDDERLIRFFHRMAILFGEEDFEWEALEGVLRAWLKGIG